MTYLNFSEDILRMLLINKELILQAAPQGGNGLHAGLSHFQTGEALGHGAAGTGG